jgi:hypothetical protein
MPTEADFLADLTSRPSPGSRHDASEGRKDGDGIGKGGLEEGQCGKDQLETKKPPPPRKCLPSRPSATVQQIASYRIYLSLYLFLLLDKIRPYQYLLRNKYYPINKNNYESCNIINNLLIIKKSLIFDKNQY